MERLTPNPRVKFYSISHSYLMDSVFFLMGVTELMKKHGLSADYTGIEEEKMEKARERGTKGHKEIENYCKGKKYRPTAITKNFKALNLDVLESEFLISDNEMIASKIDLILSDYSVVDIKFTSQLHIEALQWQLSIYAYLLELNYNIQVPKVYALHFNKQNKPSLVEIQRLDNRMVIALLNAEREGRIYQPLPLAPTTADEAVQKLFDVCSYIEGLQAQIKEAEIQKEALQQEFLARMEESGTKSIVTDFCKITYVASTTKESIDSKALRENAPEIFEQYKKISITKPYVKFTITKKDVQ